MLLPRLLPGGHPAFVAGRPHAPLPRADLVRAFACCWIAVAGVSFAADLWRQTAYGLTDGAGRPFGDDFINFWSGPFLAWRGAVAHVYDWRAYHVFQEGVVGGALDFYHYSYPPLLLLLTAPLVVVPYVPALGAWLVSSWFAFYRVLRLMLPEGGALLFSLATPALFVNAVGGQNGAWTAALFGGGLCLLDRRPIVAGALFGLLAYKPHLGILLPIALVAGHHWRALAAAAVTVGGLALLSAAVFGVDVWQEYFRNAAILRQTVLEDGTGVWHRMVSVFVLARRLGADVAPAYAIQLGVALLAAGTVAWAWWRAWWRDAAASTRNALLVLGTCLATPYLQDYDLVLGAFVAVWLMQSTGAAGARRMAAPICAALVLLLPIVAAPLAQATGMALGPLFVAPAFLLAAMSLRQPPPSSSPEAGTQ